ncbi:hypothetical protein GCM10007415_40810 [Parapedobacter pyrenivorans]|uniref:DUF4153 domain-containing protein n=2 Tax=Parapedobacter pyrenivorans TaxID=1305674 RepID=A0A917I142_9SPHI|nr:hypothetical protein GCM10007415_40810 [Parapedobacter pyrenivorans]
MLHRMKLPSLGNLYKNAIIVFKRFPTLFVTVVFATALCCFLLDEPAIGNATKNKLWQLLATCNLLFTLGLSVDLFAESKTYTPIRKWVLRVAAMVLCLLLYTVLDPSEYHTDVVRFGLFAFAFHQLVAFAPFITHNGSNNFWHFNKSIFLRFLTAALYSLTLFVGLAIAIFAVEELFNLDLPSKIYSQLFAVIAIGFNTLFFLAGVPTAFDRETLGAQYPKGLKIFTQYVLIPLMTIYLGILLIYEIKILADWELPKGIVATLIMGYAVFGILSLLLVWPIKSDAGNRWVRLFSQFFYLTLIPLLALLAFAIYKRVANYGFTEERHILLVLGLWLAGISGYSLLFRKDNIKLIPMSLFAVALLSTFGPQSAANISRQSQQTRLAEMQRVETTEDTDQAANIVSYLVDTHGLQSLQDFTETDLGVLDKEITEKHAELSRYSINSLKRDTIFTLLNISPGGAGMGRYLYITRDDHGLMPISGYNYGYRVESYQAASAEVRIGSHRCEVVLDQETREVTIEMDNDSTIVFSLVPLIDEIYQAYKDGRLTKRADGGDQFSYPSDRMRLQKENSQFAVALMLEQLNGNFRTNRSRSDYGFSFSGYLLFKEK